jgi:hypothetical protein
MNPLHHLKNALLLQVLTLPVCGGVICFDAGRFAFQ